MLAHADAQKILLLHVGTEPSALDPQQVRGIPESKILSCLFEGLVIPDPTDSTKQLPGVADSWEHNEDSSIWTFHLRTNARWSNGDPVTATDFAFSLQRILRPELGALFADYLYIIRGDSNWSNLQFDSLLDKASLIGDAPRRLSKLREAEELLVRDAPLLPIY
jgi:oligopeptide transport system substrate-binding protein